MPFYCNDNYKFGPILSSDSCNGVKPKFGDFQLLGDSLLVRFADKILRQPNRLINGARTIGLCVSGQRINQLREKIEKNTYPVTKNVLLLIGTNDVLCGGDIYKMMKHFKKLLKTIKKTADKVVVLTLPPIPRLCVTYYHWTIIRNYNQFLKTLHNNDSVIVVDICRLFTKFEGVFLYHISFNMDYKKFLSVKKKTDVIGTPSVRTGTKRKPCCDICSNKKLVSCTHDLQSESKKPKINQNDKTQSNVSNGLSTLMYYTSRRPYNTQQTQLDNNKPKIIVKLKNNPTQTTVKTADESEKNKNVTSRLNLTSQKNDSLGTQNNHKSPAKKTKSKESSPRLFLKSLQEATGKCYLKKFEEKTTISTDNNWDVIEEPKTPVSCPPEVLLGEENWDTDSNSSKESSEDSDRCGYSSDLQIQIVNNRCKLKKKRNYRQHRVSVEEEDWDNNNDVQVVEKECVVEQVEQVEESSDSSDTSVEDQTKFRQQMRAYVDYNFWNYVKNHPDFNQSRDDDDEDEDFRRNQRRKSDFVRPSSKNTMEELTPRLACYLSSIPPPPPPPTPPPLPSLLSGSFNDLSTLAPRSRRSWPLSASQHKDLSDIDRKIMELSQHICHVKYYERYFGYNARKIDMIHLNYKGLDKLKNYLLDNKFIQL